MYWVSTSQKYVPAWWHNSASTPGQSELYRSKADSVEWLFLGIIFCWSSSESLVFCAGSWSTAGVCHQSGEKAEALENALKVTSFAPLRGKNSTRLSLTKKSSSIQQQNKWSTGSYRQPGETRERKVSSLTSHHDTLTYRLIHVNGYKFHITLHSTLSI